MSCVALNIKRIATFLCAVSRAIIARRRRHDVGGVCVAVLQVEEAHQAAQARSSSQEPRPAARVCYRRAETSTTTRWRARTVKPPATAPTTAPTRRMVKPLNFSLFLDQRRR